MSRRRHRQRYFSRKQHDSHVWAWMLYQEIAYWARRPERVFASRNVRITVKNRTQRQRAMMDYSDE
jgi:hypothetical protein